MEILASLDDINAELPSDDDGDFPVIVADDDNTELLQITVARVVRGYLSRLIDNSVLAGWTVPDKTPELVRTIAGKIIASQLYFNKTAAQTTEISDTSFAQKRYDEAMKMLEKIVSGEIVLEDIAVVSDLEVISSLDFFPVDATDRSFTKSQGF